MKIDLRKKITRFLVQEYLNKICNFETEVDLDWDTHKLIHTFQVVAMANKLIHRAKSKLSQKQQEHILNAALLHDIARCHEFKKGRHLKNVDHGDMGAKLIKKHFPKMAIEAQVTQFHNKLPSEKDPKRCKIILDYVRDADMLANIEYQIIHPDIWLKHILKCFPQPTKPMQIDPEIYNAVCEHRLACAQNVKNPTFLDMILGQLCWYYGLKTKAAIKIAQKELLFTRYKQTICEQILPQIIPTNEHQRTLLKQIQAIFPDDLFE